MTLRVIISEVGILYTAVSRETRGADPGYEIGRCATDHCRGGQYNIEIFLVLT